MRLFVAVDVGAEITAAVQAHATELKERTQRLAPAARVTWIPAHLMHLTVRFIGEVPEAQVAAVTDLLTPPLSLFPFRLSVHGIGAFSARGVPRVIWAGLERGAAELRAIEREVTERLRTIGIPPDDREFSPHVTVARVREPAGLRTVRLLDGYQDVALGTTTVDAITLFQSRLSSKGPTYVPLLKTPVAP